MKQDRNWLPPVAAAITVATAANPSSKIQIDAGRPKAFRWRPPHSLTAWTAVRSATDCGPGFVRKPFPGGNRQPVMAWICGDQYGDLRTAGKLHLIAL